MERPQRVLPDYVRTRMNTNHPPLLVCAYDDDRKCERLALEGSIPLSRLREREPQLGKDQEIVFYCA